MNNELFAELDFTIRRGNFEKAEQMIEAYKKQYAPGSEEFGELCYYELLTHYKATDFLTVAYHYVKNQITEPCAFYDAVLKYSGENRKLTLIPVLDFHIFAEKEPYGAEDYLSDAIDQLKNKEYLSAIVNFKNGGDLQRTAETALLASKVFLKKNAFDEALKCLDYALFDDDCYAEYEKVEGYKKTYFRFQKEIGSPRKYAVSVLEKADSDKYHKYLSLANAKGGYTDGVLHFIAVLIATVLSGFMLFDPHLDIPALYVIWGICASVALHKKFFWDFGFIKSIGATFLLCLIPVLITAFSDEVLDADGLGAIITIVITLIEFIPTLIRNIKYMNHSKAGKKAVALRTQFIEPTLGKARRQLVEKYAPLTDRATATAWANTIKL